MTRFIIAVALIMAASRANALDFAQPFLFGVTSTMTVATVNISTSSPTDIIVSTAPLYRQVCVQNIDTTSFVSCGESSSVSTVTTNSQFGVQIDSAPTASSVAIPFCFEVVPGNRFWCESASTSKASRAVIIRKR